MVPQRGVTASPPDTIPGSIAIYTINHTLVIYNPYNLRFSSTFSDYIRGNVVRCEYQIIAIRAELWHRIARGEARYHKYRNGGQIRGRSQGRIVSIILCLIGTRPYTRVTWNAHNWKKLLRVRVTLWWILSSLYSWHISYQHLTRQRTISCQLQGLPLCVHTNVIRRFEPLQSRLDYLMKVTTGFACSPKPVKQ